MSQFLAGVKHPRFHCANRRGGYCSNLLDGVAKAISEFEDKPLLDGQSIQPFLDPILLLALNGVIRAVPGEVLDESRYLLVLGSAYRFEGGTISDAYNPGRKTGCATKVPCVAPDNHKRVIDNFLEVFPAANKSR